ncbi:hypothetical protein WJX79_007963 [Trebouxia sp. C0005]
MVGSADMTNRRALEPTMSMSLFKSPEYAKEVFTWLDKHGDTPVSPPARPASAASARRRHAVGHRPSTASAGLLRGSSAYESAHSSSQPVVSASTFLPVSKQALVKKAELARPLSRTRPPLPSSDIFLPRKPAKAALELKQDAGWGRMDGVWDGPFLEWVGRSQLYSADLLSPDAAKDLEQWMQCAAPADKRHMMALLRDLHATVAPTGPRWQSVSHSTHTRQVPFGDGKELDKDLQRGTRPGTPASGTVTHKDQSATLADDKGPVGQTQAETAALHEPAAPQVQSVSRPRGINVNAVASKGTFRSSINLSQGAPATVKSTYGATHGASMPQLMAAVQTVAQQHAEAQKPVQVTCPFGSLDPLMDRAHLAVFPVPAGLLQGTTELHTDAQRSGLDETRYGQSFCSNAFKGDAAAILAAAQREKESSKAAGCRVTIPLGKKAVNCVPLYDTTYHDEFKARSVDVIQQRASAELMRSLNHAPTATVGCVTRSH